MEPKPVSGNVVLGVILVVVIFIIVQGGGDSSTQPEIVKPEPETVLPEPEPETPEEIAPELFIVEDTQSSPQAAVRGILYAASQGDTNGVYSYTPNGINTVGDWVGDILYHCSGIMIEKDKYQEDSFIVEYTDDSNAYVYLGVATGEAKFRTEKIDGKWYVAMSPDFYVLGKVCN